MLGGCTQIALQTRSLDSAVTADGTKLEQNVGKLMKTNRKEALASDPSALLQETAQAAVAPEGVGWHWEACILTAGGKEANSHAPPDYRCDSPPTATTNKNSKIPGRRPQRKRFFYAATAVITGPDCIATVGCLLHEQSSSPPSSRSPAANTRHQPAGTRHHDPRSPATNCRWAGEMPQPGHHLHRISVVRGMI